MRDLEAPARFPRQYARTARFTRGQPRSVRVAPDGSRVAFLRSAGGQDPSNRLWLLDAATGEERCVAHPQALVATEADPPADLPPEELALRERTRESAAGIVSFATDRDLTLATFALGGRLHVACLDRGDTTRHACKDAVIDPRPDPSGARVAYVSAGSLRVTDVDGRDGVVLTGPEDGETEVAWGLADFIAAEEMGRTRGYWWAPDGRRLAVTRVDNAHVQRWHLHDPAEPARVPQRVAYPATGTDNAVVDVFVVDLDGRRVRLAWDRDSYPYLVTVVWGDDGPLTLCVQSRDQRRMRVYAADPDAGTTRVVREDHDLHWLDIVAGVPSWTPAGQLVHTIDDSDTRRLAVDGEPLTPPGLQVRSVVHTTAETVTVTASGEDPTATAVWRVPLAGGEPVPLTATEGVHHATVCGQGLVLASQDLARPGLRTLLHSPAGDCQIRSLAETPVITPWPQMLQLGDRGLRAALLLPSGYEEERGALPVLLDPYGGPHAQRVTQRQDAYLVSQWFADNGFAVLVLDGRGSPGRGPAWERAVAGDLLSAPLDDQIDGLHAAARGHPLDLDRVAVRGWSFGGYLAAAAVLRRPDVFHAAVAGAPVTDWSLYDTHYTERYLGTPQDNAAGYRASSLLHDAPDVQRPLLLIHGLADDNVVAAHTLRLSQALLRGGHPHQVLPLTGVTHMTPQEDVAENLLKLELAFLCDALAVDPGR